MYVSMQILENQQGKKDEVIHLFYITTDVQGISKILLNGRFNRLNVK